VKRKIPSSRRQSNPRTPIFQPVAQRYTSEKNAWSYSFTLSYVSEAWFLGAGHVFMVWYLVKHRDNFAFIFYFFDEYIIKESKTPSEPELTLMYCPTTNRRRGK
jgi:hypothetical protein